MKMIKTLTAIIQTLTLIAYVAVIGVVFGEAALIDFPVKVLCIIAGVIMVILYPYIWYRFYSHNTYYRHIKSGKIYSVLNGKFMVKDIDSTYRLVDNPETWKDNMVLYKDDKNYYADSKKNFNNNFERL